MDVDTASTAATFGAGSVTPPSRTRQQFQRFRARNPERSGRITGTDPYWRTFEASRWIVESIRQRSHRKLDPELANPSTGNCNALVSHQATRHAARVATLSLCVRSGLITNSTVDTPSRIS